MKTDSQTVPPLTESPSQLLDVRRVAVLLGCITIHTYRLSDGGKMPRPRHVGTLVRWTKAEVEQWVADGCRPVRSVTAKGGAK